MLVVDGLLIFKMTFEAFQDLVFLSFACVLRSGDRLRNVFPGV